MTSNPPSAGRDVASQVGGGFIPNPLIGDEKMREHRQHLKTARTVGDDFTAWLDEDRHAWIGGEDFVGDTDFAAGVAAMREVERDWWASAFDA